MDSTDVSRADIEISRKLKVVLHERDAERLKHFSPWGVRKKLDSDDAVEYILTPVSGPFFGESPSFSVNLTWWPKIGKPRVSALDPLVDYVENLQGLKYAEEALGEIALVGKIFHDTMEEAHGSAQEG